MTERCSKQLRKFEDNLMKIQMLIATTDRDYTDHLSNALAEHHSDAIEVSVSSEEKLLKEQLMARTFDIALLDSSMAWAAETQSIRLPLLLWSQDDKECVVPEEIKRLNKYQRVSSIVSSVLEMYSKELVKDRGPDLKKAKISAFWSPAGGVGKTTAALAYCAGKASSGKQVMYLNLEQFSSVHTYFADTGRSISAVFEMLEAGEGNTRMLVRSLRRQDSESEIAYFSRPENFDDMNILTTDNTAELIDVCSEAADELVIDMSCTCDERTRKVFDTADRIFLVTDASNTTKMKFSQYMSQHNIYQRTMEKATMVLNKGAELYKPYPYTVVRLPLVQSSDAQTIYKTLSEISFDTPQD